MSWPTDGDRLIAEQGALAAATPLSWHPSSERHPIAGAFVCFPRGRPGPGAAGDPAWAGAALVAGGAEVVTRVVGGVAGAAYQAGLLALREGALLEAAVRALPSLPEVLLVNATGRDHPRRAGLALHLGAVLGLATVGVTHRPLLAGGEWPPPVRGRRTPLVLDGEPVGVWLCTRDGTRPLAIHAAWRTDPETAAAVVLHAVRTGARTPEPIRRARQAARRARAASGR